MHPYIKKKLAGFSVIQWGVKTFYMQHYEVIFEVLISLNEIDFG